MFAKVKSSVFIDGLRLQLNIHKGNRLHGVLKDDSVNVCSTLEKNILADSEEMTWTGLKRFALWKVYIRTFHGEDEMKVNLVKRV